MDYNYIAILPNYILYSEFRDGTYTVTYAYSNYRDAKKNLLNNKIYDFFVGDSGYDKRTRFSGYILLMMMTLHQVYMMLMIVRSMRIRFSLCLELSIFSGYKTW